MGVPSHEYRVRLNACGSVLCEPAWSFRAAGEQFPDFDLWYIWAGRGTIRVGAREHVLFPGLALCLRPRSSVQAWHDPAHRLGVCFVHFDLLDGRGRICRRGSLAPAEHSVLGSVPFYESVLKRAVEGARSIPARAQAAALVASVLHAMDAAAAAPAERPAHRLQAERIAAIAREIRQDPGRRVSIAAWADAAGYSVDHFARIFQNETGASPSEFIIRARIDRACRLLLETDLGVDEIAQTLGYADIFTFSKQFKRVQGASPTHWRAARLERQLMGASSRNQQDVEPWPRLPAKK